MTLLSVNTADAKEEFSELINRVNHHKERIILVRRGKEIAAIVPIEDLILLQESQDKADLHDAVESLKEARNLGTLSLDEFKSQVG